MNGRRKLLLAGLSMAATPVRALDSRPPRIYMILYRGETGVEKGFRDYLHAHGVAAELIVRDVALDVGKVPALLQEARALRVDLIYTWGTPVTLTVTGREGAVDPKLHVTDIPVLFTMVASPEGSGLVRSRAGSGRNITGACHVVPLAQQLGAMRAYRPFQRVGMVYNPAEPNSLLNLQEMRAASAKDGFHLIERAVPQGDNGQPLPAALPDLLDELARAQAQMLYMGPDSFLSSHRKVYTEAALARRLPAFSATEAAIRDGKALFGLVSGYEHVGRLTAFKAMQILRQGLKPGAIPVETLARFSYLVNMSVAARLDFYPPLKVLNFAELIR